MHENISLNELASRMEQITTVSGADIIAVLYSLTEIVAESNNAVFFKIEKDNPDILIKAQLLRSDQEGHHLLCMDFVPGPRLEKIIANQKPGNG